MHALLSIVLLCFVACTAPSSRIASDHDHAVRRVVALLDYVAADYGGAVSDGAITNQTEYKEQLAFLQEAKERVGALPGHDETRRQVTGVIEKATQLVIARAAAPSVADAMQRARVALIEGFELRLGPSSRPSMERGRALFAQSCAACHGPSGGGDGPAAATLDPRPRSFRDPEVTSMLSPVRAFSALTDGIAGTAMVSFSGLPDADRWSLAFYVTALRHDAAAVERGRAAVERAPEMAGLDFTALADLRDVDLDDRFARGGVARDDRGDTLAYLRAAAPFRSRDSLGDIRRALVAAKAAYGAGDATGARRARHLLTEAYLDGFEPMEARLMTTAADLVRRIEDQFLALREGSDRGMSTDEFRAGVDALLVQLEAVNARLEGETSPWSAAVAAFVVVVREGVESVLLVLLLLGLAKRAGAESDRRSVHAGWSAAIGAGIVTWFASAAVVALGGGNRELVEGIITLLAVVVLLYAGHFVLARMDAQRRIGALKLRFAAITPVRRKLMLFALSFIAAYREAFEVVLFLRAILLGAPGAGTQVAAGAALGLVGSIGVFVVIARVGKRLNTSLMLNVGGALLCVLAFVLAGKGVRSLQEAGVVGVSALDGPRVDALGIFPTFQTLAAQVLVLAVLVAVTWLAPRRAEPAGAAPSKLVS